MASGRKAQQVGSEDVGAQLRSVMRLLEISVHTQDKDEKAADKLEAKADKLEKKLDKLEAKLDKLEKKADGIETKCDSIEKKYDKLEAKLDKLEKKKDDKKKKLGTGSTEAERSAALRMGKLRARVEVGKLEVLALSAKYRPVRLRDLKPTADDRDETEADLDRNEEMVDREEKARDKQEEALDALEKDLDKLEADLDGSEKDFDEAEKLLDKSSASQDQPKSPSPKKSSGRKTSLAAGPPPEADAGVVSELLAKMRLGGPRSRRAAKKLEDLGPAATPGLLRAYETAHEEHFRWEIVNLLGYTRDPRAIQLLAKRGVQDHELHPRWRSIWALTSVDDGSAASLLREDMARSTGLRRRNSAVALSLFDDPTAIPVLRKGLRARDTWHRWESASCLAGYADPGAARDVLALYDGEGDVSIRQEMVRAVAGVRSPQVVDFLRRRLRDPEPGVRSAAVRSLLQCANGQATRLLTECLGREKDRSVKKDIRDALGSLGPVVQPHLHGELQLPA